MQYGAPVIEAVAFDVGHTLLDEQIGRDLPVATRPIRLMPGVAEVLPQIRLPMAAWANTRSAGEADIRLSLRRAGIEHFFSFVITSQEAAARKPLPQFFDYALSVSNWRRESVLFVGNQINTDVAGGLRAGIATVWLSDPAYRSVDDTGAHDAIRPTYTIASLRELPALIDGLRRSE